MAGNVRGYTQLLDKNMKALNINQLKKSVELKIAEYEEMIQGEIRTIGLRDKIIRRKTTLNKVLKLLSNHCDIPIVSDSKPTKKCNVYKDKKCICMGLICGY